MRELATFSVIIVGLYALYCYMPGTNKPAAYTPTADVSSSAGSPATVNPPPAASPPPAQTEADPLAPPPSDQNSARPHNTMDDARNAAAHNK